MIIVMNDYRTSCAEEPASAQDRCETNSSRRILVVDEDTCTRRSSAQALLLSGYRVDATDNDATGWEALNANSYDLLITGNNLPKMSAVELLKKLHAARIPVPVIMVSETLPLEELTNHPWLRFAAILPKPCTGHELLGKVKKVLRATGGTRGRIKPRSMWRSAISRWFKALKISFKAT